MFNFLKKFKTRLTAKNSALMLANVTNIFNAGVADFQKIKTAEITIPVIMADVLHYAPGELGSSTDIGRDGADVMYSEESLKDKDFLESIRRSPISIATHEKNTSEHNREVDGWLTDAWYDDNLKGVFAKGYVSGADNIRYVEQRKRDSGFGTSAFIDFLGVRKQNGTSSTGKEFSAITTKLICNHVAILPNIRDSKNVIVALNAINTDEMKSVENGNPANDKKVSQEMVDGMAVVYMITDDKFYYAKIGWEKVTGEMSDLNSIKKEVKEYIKYRYPKAKNDMIGEKELTEQSTNIKDEKSRGNMPDIDKDQLKNALTEMKNEDKEKAEYDEFKNSVKNMDERLAKIEGFMTKNKAKNADSDSDEKKDDDKDEADNAKNEDSDVLNEADKVDKEEKEIAKNALPGQGLIKDVSEMLDIDFKKTPTFYELGKLLQVSAKTLPETISAINAKREDYKKTKIAVKNSNGETVASTDNTNVSFFEALERI